MAHPDWIAHIKNELSNKSDDELLAIKIDGAEMRHDPDAYNKHLAASQLLRDRRLARENANHAELLAEIKRPHWSVTPGFYVGVVAMIAACLAVYYSRLAYVQAQLPAAVVAPSTKTTPAALDSSSSSHTQLESASPQQPESTKN